MDEFEQVREALRDILNELGVPDEDYPAPVANAVDIALTALATIEKGWKALNEANDLVRKMTRDGLAEKDTRIQELEAVLREIAERTDGLDERDMRIIARAALTADESGV